MFAFSVEILQVIVLFMKQPCTFQVNEHVRVCAILPEDMDLLAKLSTTDMVALDAEYHTKHEKPRLMDVKTLMKWK